MEKEKGNEMKTKVENVVHNMSVWIEKIVAEIYDLPGEDMTEFMGDRWQYVGVRYTDGTNRKTYYHANCDCLVDENAKCLLCGASSPCAVN